MRNLLLLPFFLIFVACATSDDEVEGQKVFQDENTKNNYFDRFNEFANFGHHDDYNLLLGFNFGKVGSPLISTSIFDFNLVARAQQKTRKFVLVNPTDNPLKSMKYRVEGDRAFSLVDETCGAEITPRKICTISIRFLPLPGAPLGQREAQLIITSPSHQPILKELRGTVN